MKKNTKEPILYVDDEIENLEGFRYTFMLDYDISVAKSAKEGLKLLEQKEYKIVITDQKMPEMSGIEFLKIVKEKFTDAIRIVLTAYADATSAIEAINTGEIYRFLSKPWTKTDLKATIENAIETYNLKQKNRELIVNLKDTNHKLSKINNKLKENINELEEAENIQKILTEELIQQKEKAEESDSLKTEFINNMSHEIRTPMNGILGFSDILNDPSLSEKKRNNYISIIQNCGKQLLRIIDDILEISILGTKQVKAIETEVCLNDLLLELFSIFDKKAKENKTPLYLKKELSDSESIIFTDRTKLNKILSNLLENALKFTNEGRIEFGYKIVNINNEKILLDNKQEKYFQIWVKDTGIGIHITKQELIFDRFSQAEKEISQKAGGLGLGLSIAKENTELLGGNITLKSKKGEGAIFYVTIPYNPVIRTQNPATGIQNQANRIQNQKYTILIVEDEEINSLFLDLLLEKSKHNIKTLHAINGEEAVEICKNNPKIKLVFMDIKLPIMDGYEATKLIREFRPNLPIIAQTAHSTKEFINKATQAGCNDFISKPISQKTLYKIINNFLNDN